MKHVVYQVVISDGDQMDSDTAGRTGGRVRGGGYCQCRAGEMASGWAEDDT